MANHLEVSYTLNIYTHTMTSPIQCLGIYPREIKTCSQKDLETIPYDLYTQGPYGKNKNDYSRASSSGTLFTADTFLPQLLHRRSWKWYLPSLPPTQQNFTFQLLTLQPVYLSTGKITSVKQVRLNQETAKRGLYYLLIYDRNH